MDQKEKMRKSAHCGVFLCVSMSTGYVQSLKRNVKFRGQESQCFGRGQCAERMDWLGWGEIYVQCASPASLYKLSEDVCLGWIGIQNRVYGLLQTAGPKMRAVQSEQLAHWGAQVANYLSRLLPGKKAGAL